MNTEQILTGIADLLDEVAGVPADKVVPGASFVEDLEVDSLTMVEVVVAAEEMFDVRIPDDDIEGLVTVADVVAYVEVGAGSRRERVTLPAAAVTGLGAVTPLGRDVEALWDGVLAGRSGVRLFDDEWAAGLPVRLAATVTDDLIEIIGRVPAGRLDRAQQLALVATREALAARGLADRRPSTPSASRSSSEPASAG